jgi:hypothetical protein
MSTEQITTSNLAQLEETYKLEQKPDRNLFLRATNEKNIATLNHLNNLVYQSIGNAVDGKGDFGFDTSQLSPEIIKTLRNLHKLKLSKANPEMEITEFSHRKPEVSIIQKPCDLIVSCPYSGETFTGGVSILEMLKHKHPNFTGKSVFLGQGSASKPCPNGFEIETAIKIAKENKALIMGGTGIKNSLMEEFCKKYLEYADPDKASLTCITPPELMDTSKPHFEKPFYTDDNHQVLPEYKGKVISLVAPNLGQRLGLFHYLTTKGKPNTGEVGFKYGGNGTFAELYAILLQLAICPELGTFDKIHFSKNGLWDESSVYFAKKLNIKI